jgi:hypothetical protein
MGKIGLEEAAILFRKYARLRYEESNMDDEVSRIINKLGFLILAIILAGSYIRAIL